MSKHGFEIKRGVPHVPHTANEVVKSIVLDHERQGVNITPTTAITHWDGGSMDYGVAIQQLF